MNENLEIKKETYNDIRGYEGLYKISSLGNVLNAKTGRKLKLQIANGYFYIGLGFIKPKKQYRVSRLVAIAFVPNTQNKPYVNHKDGIKTNNHYLNLEWVTQSENLQHSRKMGMTPLRTNNKLEVNQVLKIRKLYEDGNYTQTRLGEIFGCSRRNVSFIVNRKRWGSVL
jgi:hypothetical protein